jgi:hypothetical protein
MTLTKWAEEQLEKINLFEDKSISPTGAIVNHPASKREMCIAVITSDNAYELYMSAKNLCPVGTIIEDYEEQWWNELLENKSSVCKVLLTKALLDERFRKAAETLLKLLERRYSKHFDNTVKAKTVSVENKTDSSLNIVFTTV